MDPLARIDAIRAAAPPEGLFADKEWLATPEPFFIDAAFAEDLDKLGYRLQLFNRACNLLYHLSVAGKQPAWIADYLDRGKPPELVEYSRRRPFRDDLPGVIRPDLVLTEPGPDGRPGYIIAELDNVPGGIGLTHWLNTTYAPYGHDILGGPDGMLEGFRAMLGGPAHIVVSEEAATYKPEMQYLARLAGGALQVHAAASYSPEGWGKVAGGKASETSGTPGTDRNPDGTPAGVQEADASAAPAGADAHGIATPGVSPPANLPQPSRLIYRFFENFDLPNVPSARAIMDAAAAGAVRVTPPFKPFLEEKLWFALFWLRPLREFWRRELSERQFLKLQEVIPYTWILDPTPLPQHGVIPGLDVHEWAEVARFSQKQRELILKISGFSEIGWGSRGVVLGSDAAHGEWQSALQRALDDFPHHPWILQRFHKGRLVEQPYLDPRTGTLATLRGRVRLCPYYFVVAGKTRLGGALATIAPADKKLLHGMRDAIMAPTAIRG